MVISKIQAEMPNWINWISSVQLICDAKRLPRQDEERLKTLLCTFLGYTNTGTED